MSDTIAVLLVNYCFHRKECTKSYATPQNLRRHLTNLHNYTFPKRLDKIRRVSDENFWFLKDSVKDESVITRFASPCCIAHIDQLTSLYKHFYSDHPKYVPSQESKNTPSTSASVHNKPQSESTLVETVNDDTTRHCGNESSIEFDTTADRCNKSTIESDSTVDHSNDSNIENDPNATDPSNDTQQSETSTKRCHHILLTQNLSFSPPLGESLITGDFNISEALYKLQNSLKQHKWKVPLEDHMHLVLAATSVLLLTPNNYPEEVRPFFDHQEWDASVSLIQKMHNIQQPPMPLNIATKLLKILDDLVRDDIERIDAKMALKALDIESSEMKFVMALAELIKRLLVFRHDFVKMVTIFAK